MGDGDSLDTGYDMEKATKHERVLLHNRNKLEEAKQVGFEMEDMARDIKFNLRSQSDKLENKTLKNLYGINNEMTTANRLVNLIKTHRFKNKLVLYGIIALLVASILFVGYMTFAPASTEVVVQREPEHMAAVVEPEDEVVLDEDLQGDDAADMNN